MVFEMLKSLLNIHLKNVVDVLSFESNFQCLFVKTLPLTDRTRHPDIGQKIHFKLVGTISLAIFATSTGNVERKSTGLKASQFGFRQLRVKISNQIKQLDVSCRIRPRGPTDRTLINIDRFINVFQPNDFGVFAWTPNSLIDVAIQDLP